MTRPFRQSRARYLCVNRKMSCHLAQGRDKCFRSLRPDGREAERCVFPPFPYLFFFSGNDTPRRFWSTSSECLFLVSLSDLNLWNKSISQRWRKLRRRCSVQESSEPQEALIQGGGNQGVIHAVRSTPASREASPAAKSLQDGSSPKKLLQTSSLRLPGEFWIDRKRDPYKILTKSSLQNLSQFWSCWCSVAHVH